MIPRGIYYNKISKISQKHEEGKIIYFGRLTPYKNVEIIIRALQFNINEIPNSKFTIIGSGTCLDELKKESKRIGVGEKVFFKNEIDSQNDFWNEIAKSNILVQPSLREGPSIIVLESLALGIPVVAAFSSESAVQDLIQNYHTGIMISEPRNSKI